MSPRVIQLPLSGRDRRFYVQQLRAAESEHHKVCAELTEAIRVFQVHRVKAHALACREWNIRQFLGGPADPSPRILDAIDAGYPLLEVKCKRCGHESLVDIAEVVWPRENEVHTLANVLRCQQCKDERKKAQTNLVSLREQPDPDQQAKRKAR